MPGYTTRVGLGGAHQRDRRAALAALRPGIDVCPHTAYCGGAPMWPTPAAAIRAGAPAWMGRLDLGDWPGRIFGGPQIKRLEHATCNRRAGAALGNRLRAAGITRPYRKPRPADKARSLNAARRARW